MAGVAAPAAHASLPSFDVRDQERPQVGHERRADARRAATAMRHSLGAEGVVEVDAQTGTARRVADLDGFLTGKSRRDPIHVALDYVRAHPSLFALDSDDIRDLKLVRRYTSRGRVVHLAFAQTDSGIPAVDGGITANVTTDGQLVNIMGSPVPDLEAPAVDPSLSASQAMEAALRDAGSRAAAPAGTRRPGPRRTTTFGDVQQAKLVLFPHAGAVRLAWRVLVRPTSDEAYDTVVDAATGRVLSRHSLVHDVTAKVFDNYPGAAIGGTQRTATITPYLSSSTRLLGPFAWVYTDVNDDDTAQATEEVPRDGSGNYNYAYTAFSPVSGGNCPAGPFFCSWNHNTANSWKTNRKQNATQVFHYVNHYHDHLASSPIDFVPEKGNFEAADGDGVIAEPDDGAAIAAGLPDADHMNNANFFTPPDGFSGHMQMYLFRPASEAFSTVNGGDEAATVYHEYTHGLSNRLIVDSDGWGALNFHQAVSMGEAWSDWYAMDALAGEGFVQDTATNGEVKWGRYVDHGANLSRSQGLDCAVGAPAAQCPGTTAAGAGGYTYGDMGKIQAYPETHADGEIWAETLWDLRRREIADFGTKLGIDSTRLLVTAGMELSPEEPTFIDMRDAILQADQVYQGGFDHDLIWEVFAKRGMGYFASTIDPTDTRPVQSFSLQPGPDVPRGTLTGTVRNAWGDPVADADVFIGGHIDSEFGNFATFTDSSGHYTITGIPFGTYPQMIARDDDGGYREQVATGVPITENATTTRNFTLSRNWAAIWAGAAVDDVSGEDFGECVPEAAIDQHPGTSWLTSSPAYAGHPGPEYVTVELPHAVDVSSFAINPTAGNCGTGQTAALGQYRLEVSPDGTNFTTAGQGTFTTANLFKRNSVTPLAGTGKNTRYVRLVALSTQGSGPGQTGARFLEVAELEVFGAAQASARLDGQTLEYDAPPGKADTVTLSLVGSDLRVKDTTAPALRPGAGCTTVATREVKCPSAGIFFGHLSAGDRSDTITVNAGLASRILGGDGDDTLTGGPANDVLDGGTGADALGGGGGVDRVEYTDRDAQLTADIDNVADDGNAADGPAGARDNIKLDVENLTGGLRNDTLTGSPGNNVLDGGPGSDTLNGLAGIDMISYATRSFGEPGVAVTLDGARNDGKDPNADGVSTTAEEGDRDINIENAAGGSAADIIKAVMANSVVNVLFGGPGTDKLKTKDGTATVDQVDCGAGTDQFDVDPSDTQTDCETATNLP